MTRDSYRKALSHLIVVLCGLAVALALVPLAFVLFYVVSQGISSLSWSFFTEMPKPVGETGGGMANAVMGSMMVVGIGALFAIPLGIVSGIYASEYAGSRLAAAVRFAADTLNGVPSIVYGLWGVFVLVPFVRQLQVATPEWLRGFPLFSGPPLGVGMLSAALILAIMVIPFSSSVAREVLKSVPQAQREGAYALGATRWEAIRMALFYARTGIVGAVMLGFGRALGETMAVTMVIGNNPQISWSLFAPQYTMAAVLANEFTEAADDLYLNALVEIGLVLFVITLIINVISRLFIWSMGRQRKPRATRTPLVKAAA